MAKQNQTTAAVLDNVIPIGTTAPAPQVVDGSPEKAAA